MVGWDRLVIRLLVVTLLIAVGGSSAIAAPPDGYAPSSWVALEPGLVCEDKGDVISAVAAPLELTSDGLDGVVFAARLVKEGEHWVARASVFVAVLQRNLLQTIAIRHRAGEARVGSAGVEIQERGRDLANRTVCDNSGCMSEIAESPDGRLSLLVDPANNVGLCFRNAGQNSEKHLGSVRNVSAAFPGGHVDFAYGDPLGRKFFEKWCGPALSSSNWQGLIGDGNVIFSYDYEAAGEHWVEQDIIKSRTLDLIKKGSNLAARVDVMLRSASATLDAVAALAIEQVETARVMSPCEDFDLRPF